MTMTPVRRASALVFSAAVLLLLFGAAGLDGLRKLESHFTGDPWDVCAFKARYGVGCLGCGGTHAFRYAARGRMAAALQANRLGAVLGGLTWVIALGALLSTLTGRARYLVAALAAGLVVMPFTLVAHGWLWWRGLPPGLHFG